MEVKLPMCWLVGAVNAVLCVCASSASDTVPTLKTTVHAS